MLVTASHRFGSTDTQTGTLDQDCAYTLIGLFVLSFHKSHYKEDGGLPTFSLDFWMSFSAVWPSSWLLFRLRGDEPGAFVGSVAEGVEDVPPPEPTKPPLPLMVPFTPAASITQEHRLRTQRHKRLYTLHAITVPFT